MEVQPVSSLNITVSGLFLYGEDCLMGREENFKKGREGEHIAALFLENKGFRIIERNFKTHCGEIDIIASYGNELVFVEVKARKGYSFGIGADAVNYAKKMRLSNAAEIYISKNGAKYGGFRFDVISVDLPSMRIIEADYRAYRERV